MVHLMDIMKIKKCREFSTKAMLKVISQCINELVNKTLYEYEISFLYKQFFQSVKLQSVMFSKQFNKSLYKKFFQCVFVSYETK